jgi:tetratricopeptide (TPR) repeat protein
LVQMLWVGDANKAADELKVAIRLNPGDATAHQWYADALATRARMPEALEEMRRAVALDPDSVPANNDLAKMYYLAHDFDRALETSQRTLAMAPGFLQGHIVLHNIRVQRREYDQAMAEYATMQRLAPASAAYPISQAAALQRAYATEGIRGFWRVRVAYLRTQFKDDWELAQYLSLLGQYDAALRALQAGTAANGTMKMHLVFLASDPAFDGLREDQRFRRIESGY